MSITPPIKMVLHCDQAGNVLRADERARGLLTALGCEGRLPLLVERGSAAKCERFLQRIRSAGAAFGWELNVPVGERVAALLFGGLQREQQIVVAAGDTHRGLLRALDESLDGEQTEQAETAVQVGSAHETFDEMARVNNELVSLQRELAKRNAQLAALTEQRNRLLATAAHDLRNPILVVQGYCELLGMGRENGGRKNELVGKVEHAAELMLHVIEDTLEYASLETGKVRPRPSPVQLAELVARCADSYRPAAERKGISLLVRQGEPVPTLPLDASNMERVIGNLLSNAIKFSSPGGEVVMELSYQNGRAVLAVIDRGPGIAESEIPLLFRPFQTASARPTAGESSTGLGLAIVRELVQANGGEISVRSRVDEGSRFEVSFPAPHARRSTVTRVRQPNINMRPGRTREPH